MKCSICGFQFEEDKGTMTCRGCILFKGCNMLRCPNCGYEMPAEPKLVKILKKRRKDRKWI